MKNLIEQFGIMTTKTINGYKETVFYTKVGEWKQEGDFDVLTDLMLFDSEKSAFDFLDLNEWDKPEPFKASELL